MKRPLVDYHDFRLSRLNRPEYAHIRLLVIGWLAYFALYFLTENLIPPERCHPMHCRLDDLIPFCEGFLVFYVGWFFLVAGSLLYYFLHDTKRFTQLQVFIMITQAVAMFCYIVYPSRQDLRPETFPRENVLTWILGFIYSFDTSTGVCPSLHVAYSLGIWSVFSKDPYVSRLWKIVLPVLVILISLATAFVKQHSMVDVFAALGVGLLAEILVYGKYWKAKLQKKPDAGQ